MKEYINLYDAHGRSLGATNEWQRVPDAFDYIIFKDGNVTKAKNGKTGKIEFKSTSATGVIQYVLNQGGTILIKAGEYEIDQPLTIIRSGTAVYGETPTYAWHEGKRYGTILKKNFDGDLLSADGGDAYIHEVSIKDIVFNCQSKTGKVISLRKVVHCFVDNCNFLGNKDTVVSIDTVYVMRIKRCNFEDCGDTDKPTILSSPTVDKNVSIYITRNNFERDKHSSIRVEGNSEVTIVNNFFEGTSDYTYPASYFIDVQNASPLRIIDNEFVYGNYGILSKGGVVQYIARNNFQNTRMRHIYVSNASGSAIIAYNYIYGSDSADDYGIYYVNYSEEKGGAIVAFNTMREVDLKWALFVAGHRHKIVGNTIQGMPTSFDRYAIAISGKYNIVTANIVTNMDDSTGKYKGIADSGVGGDYNIIYANEFYNVDDKYILAQHTYCDEHLYTSLPSDGFAVVNKPVHYYDGANYYLAVWDGSTWRKVQLT